jgi:hypothetical protein
MFDIAVGAELPVPAGELVESVVKVSVIGKNAGEISQIVRHTALIGRWTRLNPSTV